MTTVFAWLAGGKGRDTANHALRTVLQNEGFDEQTKFTDLYYVRLRLEAVLFKTNGVNMAIAAKFLTEIEAQHKHGGPHIWVKRIGTKSWDKFVFLQDETMEELVIRVPKRYKIPNYKCVAVGWDNFGALLNTNLTDIVERGDKYVICPVFVFGRFKNVTIGNRQNNFRREVKKLMLELGVGGIVKRQDVSSFYDVSVWAPDISYMNDLCKRLVGDVTKKKNNNKNKNQNKPISKKKNQNIKNGNNDDVSVVSNANANDKNNESKENNNNGDKNGKNDENEEKKMMANDKGDNESKENDKKKLPPIGKMGDSFSLEYEHPRAYMSDSVYQLTTVAIFPNNKPPLDGRLSADDTDASAFAASELQKMIRHFYV